MEKNQRFYVSHADKKSISFTKSSSKIVTNACLIIVNMTTLYNIIVSIKSQNPDLKSYSSQIMNF